MKESFQFFNFHCYNAAYLDQHLNYHSGHQAGYLAHSESDNTYI